MAISYPRTMPDGYDYQDSEFRLSDSGTSFSRTDEGRALSVVEFADPYWTAVFRTEPLEQEDRKRWSAWHSSLRGGLQTFYARDFSRKFPLAYPNGVPYLTASPPWDGQGTIASISAHELICDGTPEGFQLKEGDLVGLVEDGRRHFFEVPEDCATLSGGGIIVPVNPAVPLEVFTAAADVVFYRPTIIMKIVPGSFDCPAVGGLADVSFEAVQVI
jgi:hypothetical protein